MIEKQSKAKQTFFAERTEVKKDKTGVLRNGKKISLIEFMGHTQETFESIILRVRLNGFGYWKWGE
jgi:hypothetical protein